MLNQFEYYKKRHKKGSTHQVWQEGAHPQEILTETISKEEIDYIHNNPVKAGYVEKPEYWIYSYASNYIIENGIPDIEIYEF